MKNVKILFFGWIIGMFSCTEVGTIEKELENLKYNNKIVGASFLITKNDKPLTKYQVGFSNLQRREKISQETAFRIGKLSNLVIALGIQRLRDFGKLTLDTPVSDFLNFKFQNYYDKEKLITLRHLLSHTSGLTDTLDFVAFKKELDTNSEAKIKRLFVKDLQQFNPKVWNGKKVGETYEYSALGYGILAKIIENIAEESLENFLQQQLFSPYQIKATFTPEKNDILKSIATTYHKKLTGSWEPIYDENTLEYPIVDELTLKTNSLLYPADKGLRMDINNLSSILKSMINGKPKLVSHSSRKILMNIAFEQYDRNYGLGIEQYKMFENELLFGNIEYQEGIHIMLFNPINHYTIALLINGAEPPLLNRQTVEKWVKLIFHQYGKKLNRL